MLMMTDPPMSLGVCLRVHSFVRSIHKAEAGDAPIGTRCLLRMVEWNKWCRLLRVILLIFTSDGAAYAAV